MATDRDKQRERQREWYRKDRAANPEKYRKRQRDWRAANPEKARELDRRQNEKRRLTDPEKWRAYRHAEYLANREKEIDQALRWQQEHPERVRELKREHSRRLKRRDPQGESDRFRRMKLARLHGMRPDEWSALWDAQGGLCYLCGDDLSLLTPQQVHVEHDHRCCPKETSCGFCRRGLACFRCNALIGMARDDPERLRRIADNLAVALADADHRLAAKPEQGMLEGIA